MKKYRRGSRQVTTSYLEKLRTLQPLAAQALQRLDRTVVITPNYAQDKWCNKCQSFWPRTDEFFYRTSSGNFHSPCKACIAEQKQEASAIKPCCVDGCNQPRNQRPSGKYDSRCPDHLLHVLKRKGTVQP